MQTESNFNPGNFEAMLELFVFIFALVLNNENSKANFIESMMNLDEDV